jgi:hypothetical protein
MEARDTKMVRTDWICADPGFLTRMRQRGIGTLSELSSRCLGEPVTDHRSSWVRRWDDLGKSYYIKTYDYSSWRDRCRGVGRTTLFARSRAHREKVALEWLQEHGFGGPAVRGVAELRHYRILVRAVLVTDAWPGEALAHILPAEPPTARAEVLEALGRFVEAMHRGGFRDRNLDLRNILARRDAMEWRFAKIDSPRHRITSSDRLDDELARADWQRLTASLAAIDLTWPKGSIGARRAR